MSLCETKKLVYQVFILHLLFIGQLFPYKVGKKIGEGAFGTVHKGTRRSDGLEVKTSLLYS